MAKGRSGRRYARDARGRFASKGYSGQTSGTGSRLKAGGKTRAGGGKVVSPKKMSGAPSNTISKSSTKREVNANSKKLDSKLKVDTNSAKLEARIKKDRAAALERKAKKTGANNARATGGLTRPTPESNIRRTNARLGPNNNIKPGPKSPRTKLKKAVRDSKGSGEKLRDVRKKADGLRNKWLNQDKGRMKKAFDKPSVTDKRSRDYLGKLTKEGKRQDPGTGGKKSRKRKKR